MIGPPRTFVIGSQAPSASAGSTRTVDGPSDPLASARGSDQTANGGSVCRAASRLPFSIHPSQFNILLSPALR